MEAKEKMEREAKQKAAAEEEEAQRLAREEEALRLEEEAQRKVEEEEAQRKAEEEEAQRKAEEEEARRRAEEASRKAVLEQAKRMEEARRKAEEDAMRRAEVARKEAEKREQEEALRRVEEVRRQREAEALREKMRLLAAGKLQALMRGRRGRRTAMEKRIELEEEERIRVEKAEAERKRKEKMEVAMKAQREAYEKRRLAAEKEKREKEEAAVKIQRLFRGAQDRKWFEAHRLELRLRQRAKLNVQRPVSAVSEATPRQGPREYRCQKACIKIQSLFRGWRVRKEPVRGGKAVAHSMDEFEYPAILEEAVLEYRTGQEAPNTNTQALLKTIAEVLRQQQHIKVCIYGHTKSSEAPALAERRAEHVRQALVNSGVLRNQLRTMVKPATPGAEGHAWVTFSIIQEIKLKNPITFEPGYSELSEGAKTALLHVARVLAEHPHLSLRIEGHTDIDETKLPYTQPPHHLAEERSSVAVRHLEEVGVHRHRLEFVGRSAECPVATNLTWQGRSQNRRIELHLVDVMKESMEHQGNPQYQQTQVTPASSRSSSKASGKAVGKGTKRAGGAPSASSDRNLAGSLNGSRGTRGVLNGGAKTLAGRQPQAGRSSLPKLGGSLRGTGGKGPLKSVSNIGRRTKY